MMKVLVGVLVLAVFSVHSASLTKKELLEELLDLLERDGPELDKRGAIFASRDGGTIKLYPQKQDPNMACPCPFRVFWKTGLPPKTGLNPKAVYNTREFFVEEVIKGSAKVLKPIELSVDKDEDYSVVICGSVSATAWGCQAGQSKCASSGVDFETWCQNKNVNEV